MLPILLILCLVTRLGNLANVYKLWCKSDQGVNKSLPIIFRSRYSEEYRVLCAYLKYHPWPTDIFRFWLAIDTGDTNKRNSSRVTAR
jgi:hypothetical protein